MLLVWLIICTMADQLFLCSKYAWVPLLKAKKTGMRLSQGVVFFGLDIVTWSEKAIFELKMDQTDQEASLKFESVQFFKNLLQSFFIVTFVRQMAQNFARE